MTDEDDIDVTDEAPVFGRWGTWYLLVIGSLVLLIVLFYFLTKHYS